MSVVSMPKSIGHTLDLSIFLASAPASNIIQGASRLSLVKQSIPIFDSSSSFDISAFHRAPLDISSGEKYGFTA